VIASAAAVWLLIVKLIVPACVGTVAADVKHLLLLATLVLAALLASCGGGGNEVPVRKASSPEELGGLVSQTYVAMLNEAARLVAPKPDAEQVKPNIEALKERYARALVAYGRQREAMSKEDKDKVVLVARLYLEQHPPQNFGWWVDAVNTYSANESVSHTIYTLRDLTQYAFWELLKKQEPEEAKRFGVK
jgi:hypothetical protein